MINFKELRKQCAACRKPDSECPTCRTHQILNNPCDMCGDIGGVVDLAIATKTGNKSVKACPICLNFLT